jgi:hypothetical protein
VNTYTVFYHVYTLYREYAPMPEGLHTKYNISLIHPVLFSTAKLSKINYIKPKTKKQKNRGKRY